MIGLMGTIRFVLRSGEKVSLEEIQLRSLAGDASEVVALEDDQGRQINGQQMRQVIDRAAAPGRRAAIRGLTKVVSYEDREAARKLRNVEKKMRQKTRRKR